MAAVGTIAPQRQPIVGVNLVIAVYFASITKGIVKSRNVSYLKVLINMSSKIFKTNEIRRLTVAGDREILTLNFTLTRFSQQKQHAVTMDCHGGNSWKEEAPISFLRKKCYPNITIFSVSKSPCHKP